MILKYDIDIDDIVLKKSLEHIVGQIYKLLPTREEGKNWQKPLQTIMEELGGMSRMIKFQQERFLPLLNKLEGLFLLTSESDFLLYRRTIFECLNIVAELEDYVIQE